MSSPCNCLVILDFAALAAAPEVAMVDRCQQIYVLPLFLEVLASVPTLWSCLSCSRLGFPSHEQVSSEDNRQVLLVEVAIDDCRQYTFLSP